MYKILLKGATDTVVYDAGATYQYKRIIRDAQLHTAVNEVATLEFTIETDHPAYGLLEPQTSELAVLDDGTIIFYGYIVDYTDDLYGTRTVRCESTVGRLNDTVMRPHVFPDSFTPAPADYNTVEYYLKQLLAADRNWRGSALITAGTVTVTDPNNYIKRELNSYSPVWQMITEQLPGSSLGGYIVTRYNQTNGQPILDYLATLPQDAGQTVAFAHNLLAFEQTLDRSGAYSDILPIGADGLTISDLPDGALTSDVTKVGDHLHSARLAAAIGTRVMTLELQDVTLATNLRSKALAALNAMATTSARSVTVQAVDLHMVDAGTPSFRVGTQIHVINEARGLTYDSWMPVLTMDVDLLDAANTTLTLGVADTITSDTRSVDVASKERDDAQQGQINKLKKVSPSVLPVPIAEGGTGGNTRTAALSNLFGSLTSVTAIGNPSTVRATWTGGYRQWGKLVYVSATAKATNAWGASSETLVGVVPAPEHLVALSVAAVGSFRSVLPASATVRPNGNLYIDHAARFETNTEITITGVYMAQ